MTHTNISTVINTFIEDVCNDVSNTMLNGDYAAWEDLCVESKLPQELLPNMELRVWGETTDNGKHAFSISLFGHQNEEAHIKTILATKQQLTVALQSIIATGLASQLDTLQSRDAILEHLWNAFDDVPMDCDTECIEEPFLGFEAGTNREDIWHWFDARHSKGVAYLMYHGTEDIVAESKRLYAVSKLCTECDAERCVFNPKGICLVPFITGKSPALSDDGCANFCFDDDFQDCL